MNEFALRFLTRTVESQAINSIETSSRHLKNKMTEMLSFISTNGPHPLASLNVIEDALNVHFKGKPWHFDRLVIDAYKKLCISYSISCFMLSAYCGFCCFYVCFIHDNKGDYYIPMLVILNLINHNISLEISAPLNITSLVFRIGGGLVACVCVGGASLAKTHQARQSRGTGQLKLFCNTAWQYPIVWLCEGYKSKK